MRRIRVLFDARPNDSCSILINPYAERLDISLSDAGAFGRALLGARNATEDLDAGITSARIVGHSGIDGDVALRDAVNAGWIPGPRLQLRVAR